MKVLVTGHKGFIGTNVFFNLRLKGYDVDGIDKKDGIYVGEVEDLSKYDVIVHTAAELFKDFHLNYETTKHIVERARGKVIFTSSAAVYGNTPVGGATEETPVNPYGDYGKTKYMEEQLIRTLPEYSIFRLANVYGPYSNHGVIFGFALEGWEINGDGQQVRDFVHVDDLIPVISQSVEGKYEGLFNLGSGKGVPIDSLYKHMNPTKRPEFTDAVTEIQYSVLNSDKAKALGFKPRRIYGE